MNKELEAKFVYLGVLGDGPPVPEPGPVPVHTGSAPRSVQDRIVRARSTATAYRHLIHEVRSTKSLDAWPAFLARADSSVAGSLLAQLSVAAQLSAATSASALSSLPFAQVVEFFHEIWGVRTRGLGPAFTSLRLDAHKQPSQRPLIASRSAQHVAAVLRCGHDLPGLLAAFELPMAAELAATVFLNPELASSGDGGGTQWPVGHYEAALSYLGSVSSDDLVDVAQSATFQMDFTADAFRDDLEDLVRWSAINEDRRVPVPVADRAAASLVAWQAAWGVSMGASPAARAVAAANHGPFVVITAGCGHAAVSDLDWVDAQEMDDELSSGSNVEDALADWVRMVLSEPARHSRDVDCLVDVFVNSELFRVHSDIDALINLACGLVPGWYPSEAQTVALAEVADVGWVAQWAKQDLPRTDRIDRFVLSVPGLFGALAPPKPGGHPVGLEVMRHFIAGKGLAADALVALQERFTGSFEDLVETLIAADC